MVGNTQLYRVNDSGVTKILESWQIVLPLHDNSENEFPKEKIDAILESIATSFPGLTSVSCSGMWRSGGQMYRDQNLQVIVDAVPDKTDSSAAFFANLKIRLMRELSQEKIYVTKQAERNELLTFDEFFAEVGIQSADFQTPGAALNAAREIAESFEYVRLRMGYRTVSLLRDKKLRRIRWERELFGIRLVSEFEDPYPEDIEVVAADDIEGLTRALKHERIAMVGDFEYQSFRLQNNPYEPLVPSQLRNSTKYPGTPYKEIGGVDLISVADYIERFANAIAVNICVLRDHGYTPREIKISVGKDGSIQRATGRLGSVLLHIPGHLPEHSFQDDALQCVRLFCGQLEDGTYNKSALQKSKAGNGYIMKRAQLRYSLYP